MKNKRLINPEKAKLVSTFIILIVVIIIVMFLSTILINSIKKQTEKLYISDMQTIVENTVTITGRKDSDGKWFATYTVSYANGDPDFISEEFELIKQ